MTSGTSVTPVGKEALFQEHPCDPMLIAHWGGASCDYRQLCLLGSGKDNVIIFQF